MSTTMEVLLREEKKKNYPFKKGQARHPLAGRKKGTPNKTTLLKEAILHQAEEKVLQEFMKIVDTTVKLANEGDTTCLKIIWDRVIPAKRAIESEDGRNDKLNVVININGMETKAVRDIEIVDGEVVEIDGNA